MHVVFGPVLVPVGVRRRHRGCEGAIRVRGARPDVALVEMGVQVDQARPDLAAVLIDDVRAGLRRDVARRPQGGDPAILDGEIDQHLLAVARQRGVDQAAPHARVDDVKRSARHRLPSRQSQSCVMALCGIPAALGIRRREPRLICAHRSGLPRHGGLLHCGHALWARRRARTVSPPLRFGPRHGRSDGSALERERRCRRRGLASRRFRGAQVCGGGEPHSSQPCTARCT